MDLSKQATEEDAKGLYDKAFADYTKAIELFILGLKCLQFSDSYCVCRSLYMLDEKNPKVKESIRRRCDEYLARAEKIKTHLEEAKARNEKESKK